MYRFLLILLPVVGMATATGAQQRQDMNKGGSDHKILVAYFSATGTTARAAKKLANVTGGELYAIVSAQPYTSADLDWNDKRSRSSVEMNDPKSRPAIKGRKENIADYDVIFIGYPIWWDLAPRIINTFIESHDLKAKQSSRSPHPEAARSRAARRREENYPALNWREGRLLNRADEKSIRNWVDNCKL